MKEEKLKIIVFVDEDLGVSIDSIHRDEINPADLEEETVEFIMDNIESLNIENLEELDAEAQKAAAINKFLEDGIIWANDHDSQLAILEFNVEAIKGVKQWDTEDMHAK